MNNKKITIHRATTCSEKAENLLVRNMLDQKNPRLKEVERLLCSYPVVRESEKEILIIKIIEHLWNISSSKHLFKVFRDFERVFTIFEKKGHFIHTFEVFLLGWTLISLLIKKNGAEVFESNKIIYNNLFDAWLFTSTAHDLGYSFQFANKLAKKLSELYQKLHMSKISEMYLKISKENYKIILQDSLLYVDAYYQKEKKFKKVEIESLILNGIESSIHGDHNDALEIQEFLKKENSHGYISALIFCRTYIEYLSKMKKWMSEKEAWRAEIMNLAAASIALHTISEKDFIRKIDFYSNPMAYLLLLIDNLQDWNRALWPNKLWPAYYLNDLKSAEKYMALEYHLYHEKWTKSMERRVKEALYDKQKRIYAIQKPNPSIDLSIKITFTSNWGHKFKSSMFDL
jgi:hypothetical protein